MNESNKIVEVTKYLSKINNIDDEIDKILEPIKDYTDTLGDIVAPVKSFIAIYSLAKRLKFKSFLKNYGKIIQEQKFKEDYFRRLEKYLHEHKNFEIIAEIIDASIESKSIKCSALLGFYAAQIIAKLKEIEYKDIVIINALKIMSDKDLEQFIALYKYCECNKKDKYRVYDMKAEFESLGYPLFDVENTIEKLKNIQVYGYDVGGIGGVGNAWGAFLFNKNTTHLWNVIKESGLIENVL